MGADIFHPIVDILIRILEVEMSPYFMFTGCAIALTSTKIVAALAVIALFASFGLLAAGHFLRSRQKPIGKWLNVAGRAVNIVYAVVICAHVWFDDLKFSE